MVNGAAQVQQAQNQREDEFVAAIALTALDRITSKRRQPEVLTFHFADGGAGDGFSISLLLPKAGEAAKSVKLAVYRIHDMIWRWLNQLYLLLRRLCWLPEKNFRRVHSGVVYVSAILSETAMDNDIDNFTFPLL